MGRFVAGEPPIDKAKLERMAIRASRTAAPKGWRDFVPDGEFPTRQAIALGALVVLVWGVVAYLRREPEGLGEYATVATEALARDNQSYIKSLTTPETVDDVVNWSELLRPQLASLKEQSSGGDLNVSVVVIDQNRRQRTGLVSAFVSPNAAGGGTAGQPTAASHRPRPLEFPLYWVLDRWGKWRLDGKTTLLSAPQPEPTRRSRSSLR